jgi:dienelactone hydrolase
LTVALFFWLPFSAAAQPLAATKPLETRDDLARVMVEGIGTYLDRELVEAVKKRAQHWKPDYSSEATYRRSVAPNRERLKKILGIVDTRLPPKLELVGGLRDPALVATAKEGFKVYAVRWAVFPSVDGEGLLFAPDDGDPAGNLIIIPDAEWTPEMMAGLSPGAPRSVQIAFAHAALGFRVLIPTLIDRKDDYSGSARTGRFTNQPHREFIYRQAYQMGRHILGYEIQKVLAGVDWLEASSKGDVKEHIAVVGYGEGGLLARLSAAVDERIKFVSPQGHGGPAETLWDEPIYRNLWSYLREFGTAELNALIMPRFITAEPQTINGRLRTDLGWPIVEGPPAARIGRSGAAPGRLTLPTLQAVQAESKRHAAARKRLPFEDPVGLKLGHIIDFHNTSSVAYTKIHRENFDPAPRQKRQFDQLVDYTQNLLPEAARKRQDFFWSKLDTSSVDKFQKSQEPLRDYFWNEIIGKLPRPTMPLNPRTRLLYDTPKWKGYEVVLDLYEDVISYGILLIPNGIKPGERRPVVVCQHGLEGRPTDVCDPKQKTKYYNSFGAQLADRGFVVFAPQNPYIFKNEFRQLVRKANPLKLTLYSFIVRQHERILEYLATLPFVDAGRIAYYGLSYGGKVAMRIPALLPGYCLSICSGDFNEWIWKNITLDWVGSYMFSGEYEMYEFDLGNTFNYAEMAALIAPRPFMVERGHNDGVGLDEYVAFEYAKVRRLYARLGLADRTEIEFFQGGHEIHGQGTFAFLHRHLNWPRR